MLAVDTSDELAYEYLTLCIQEFEEAALQSGRREGFLAVAHGSTYAADVVLDTQEKTLNRVSNTRAKLRPSSGDGDVGVAGDTSQAAESTKQPLELVDEDVDLLALFGGSDTPFANYLEKCLGCSLRLRFDWQLKPLNLLAPINAFLDTLFGALDRILARLDPWRILEDICDALNHLKTLCPQDLIMVLLSLKMLLKRYMLQMFNIKLDWTAILGPLLQAIVGALTDLLDNIFQLLMAPLDCVVSGMVATNDLLKATESVYLGAKGAATQIGDFFSGLEDDDEIHEESGILYKDVSWSKPNPVFKEDPLAYFNSGEGASPLSGGNQGYDPGRLNVRSSIDPEEPPAEDALRIAAGFQIKGDMTMLDALRDPNFVNSTWLEKLIIPVKEAIAWLRETYEKFIGSLNSLTSLVGGGLSLSLDNLGILLFLTDMISLVFMIINLLKMNVGVNDWCTFLAENHQVLEEQLRARYGNVNIDAQKVMDGLQNSALAIRQGPNLVGSIKTCLNSRTAIDNSVISQWVQELEARSVS